MWLPQLSNYSHELSIKVSQICKQPQTLSGFSPSWESSVLNAAAIISSQLLATLVPALKSPFSCFHSEKLRQAYIFKINSTKYEWRNVQKEIQKKLSLCEIVEFPKQISHPITTTLFLPPPHCFYFPTILYGKGLNAGDRGIYLVHSLPNIKTGSWWNWRVNEYFQGILTSSWI